MTKPKKKKETIKNPSPSDKPFDLGMAVNKITNAGPYKKKK